MTTYTTSNRLGKQVTGANRNTWGTTLNTQLDMIDAALDGFTSLTMTGDVTLSTANGATDQARRRVINVTSTGGANRTITIPAVEKCYEVRNAGTNQVTIKTASGTGVIIPAVSSATIVCDALDCFRIGGQGWATLASANFGTSTTQEITLTGYGAQEYSVQLIGVSATLAGNLLVGFSTDGSNWTNSISLWAISGGAATIYGAVHIPDATEDAGMVSIGVEELSSNATIDSDQCQAGGTTGRTPTGASTIAWRLTGGIKYIRFVVSGGGNFDAGSYKVRGR